ncbi:MAG: hypothetical protein R3E32_11310 [Chitinophagales bacterium]
MTVRTLPCIIRRKLEKYHKYCHRLQKKWQQGTWLSLNQGQRQMCLQRLHRYEAQLQKWGIATTFSFALLTSGPSILQAQVSAPNGSEFLVNTYTTDSQEYVSVGVDDDGDFVIAWGSDGQDGSDFGIYAQRYNSSGTPQGSEFKVNTFTNNSQNVPSVGMDSDGDFVITWVSESQDGSDEGVYAQRYNSSGVPQGSEFLVNTYTTNDQVFSSIGMDSDGDFVIAWTSDGQDGASRGIYAQRYNSSGAPQGSEFKVNTYTSNNQTTPNVGMDSDGDFVIAWQSNGQDGYGYGVYAQRYNSSGTPQGSEFLVNTSTIGFQTHPKIGMDSDGDFVITWKGTDGDGDGVFMQRYNSSGVPQGSEVLVNTNTYEDQNDPDIGMDSDGDFTITWESAYQEGGFDGSLDAIYAQHFDSSGTPQGSEFKVNTYTPLDQRRPAIGMSSDGDFVIAWASQGQDGSDVGVYAQRFGGSGSGTPSVPTLSEWGLLNLALLLMTFGTIYLINPDFSLRKAARREEE